MFLRGIWASYLIILEHWIKYTILWFSTVSYQPAEDDLFELKTCQVGCINFVGCWKHLACLVKIYTCTNKISNKGEWKNVRFKDMANFKSDNQILLPVNYRLWLIYGVSLIHFLDFKK